MRDGFFYFLPENSSSFATARPDLQSGRLTTGICNAKTLFFGSLHIVPLSLLFSSR